jgi:hypothetical protein
MQYFGNGHARPMIQPGSVTMYGIGRQTFVLSRYVVTEQTTKKDKSSVETQVIFLHRVVYMLRIEIIPSSDQHTKQIAGTL